MDWSRKFSSSSPCTGGASKLAQMLYKQSQCECEITIVGSTACEVIKNEASSLSSFTMLENASVVWKFPKEQKLPGVMALDRAYPFSIDWNVAYHDPSHPLVVDIGSGNGLFTIGMAQSRKDLNFLGLEINGKLVRRCLDAVNQSGIMNTYFIDTNATSTFRSIVSSYPGDLVLVSIQVFLQSDVKAVAMRMKEQFLQYGKDKLRLSHDCHGVKINGNNMA
ncbi:Phosphoglycerate kinase isoform 2 [Hibiscus syriacus]|uniref:tRNA (guanine(46)-N(7))-methyltransferase n=1 Tax=Hibiscus syriacus TaxID=106335 RepID=A0A6A3AQ81_HIBSY|nr:Phosphoglycerate kinase isoform 2 [Hibiscus syriacus]